MAFLDLTNIRKEFSGQAAPAVEGFNLAVERGEFVSFLGPSGCGKTTTLRMVAGFEMPTSGTIHLNGVDITTKAPNQRNVGMVFQSYALFPNMTVAENIGFGMKIQKQPAEKITKRVAELLDLIHMPDKGKNYPYQLSGGQQQRVALARALAIEPQVLLLDEPLSALDAKIRDELRGEIRRIQQQLGITTIYVTHDQQEALSLSDRVVVMSKGLMEQVGTPFEIYNYPKTEFVASFVGTLNRLKCEVVDPARGQVRYGDTVIETGATINYQKGDAVSVMLRPEELRLGHIEGANHLRGEIEQVSFQGSTIRINIRLGAANLTLDLFNERKLDLPKAGETHTLAFPPHACWVTQ